MLLSAGQSSVAYKHGLADFFAGKINIPQRHPDDVVPKCGSAWDLWKLRNTLTGVQEDYFNGYFDARETCMQMFEGTLPRSIRPMPPLSAVVEAVMHTRSEHSTPRSKRSKHGDEVVTIRVNAAGSTLTWRKHVFDLDVLSNEDRDVLLSNLSKFLQPQD